jgi:hypothetical protein
MGTVSFIIIISAIIAIAGVIIYFIRDYIQYKTQVNTQFSVTQSQVNAEKTDRVANLKYVVDQINNVNDDISTTVDTTTNTQIQLAQELDKSQANYLSGLGSAFGFTDNSGAAVSIPNLPGSAQPNMQLLTNVTATMGLTAKDLQPGGNTVKLCSKTNPNKCIQFPDQSGNTYLTDMGNGAVILDGQKGTTITNGVNLTGGLNLNAQSGSGSTPSGAINPGPNQMVLQSAKVGVGNITTPGATLHVQSKNAGDSVLQLTSSNGQTLTNVGSDGTITIYAGSAIAGTITPTATGLKITTNTLEVEGNLTVRNDLKVTNGTIIGRVSNTGGLGPA